MAAESLKLEHSFPEGKPSEIVIRTGSAEPIYDPTKIELSGIITSPSEYYAKRKLLMPEQTTHVIFNKEGKYIKLFINEADRFRTEVTGSLVENKFLKGLGINTETSYSIASLSKKLKNAKRFFKDPTTHQTLMLRLRNFTTKITTTTTKEDDRAGNKKESFESKVDEFVKDSPIEFTLKVPFFEGTPEMDLKITTAIDVVNGSVVMFLECEDYEVYEDQILKEIFDREKIIFKDFVIIEQ